jgi:hypothetical protein
MIQIEGTTGHLVGTTGILVGILAMGFLPGDV